MTRPIDVHNPFKPGSVIFQLMDGDFSNMTIAEIAQKLNTKYRSITRSLSRITSETGYYVPHKMEYGNCTQPFPNAMPRPAKKKAIIKCSTCGNTKCRSRGRVCNWTHCVNWIPEDVNHGR